MRHRGWHILLGFLLVLVVGGVGGWLLLLRPIPQPDTNDAGFVFNHGSIGNESAQGLPYWIWRVMPVVFADLLPADQRGYAAFGVHWQPGAEVPVGFSVKRVGAIDRVAPNCAFCHQGTYRLRPEQPARLVTAGAGTRVDPQSYIRFLTEAGADPRFTADRLMGAITEIYAMPLWERLTYRYLLIPVTGKLLRERGEQFAWMDSRPDWGPGRIDPFNPVKFDNLSLPDDGTIGNSDMMPLWDLQVTEPTPLRNYALHWDGLLTDLHETVVAGAIGDGMSKREYAGARDNLAVMEDFIRRQQPPDSPFSSDLPPDSPFYVDPVALARGADIYAADCAVCHEEGAERFREVIPITEVGTDRHRIDMWTDEARDRYNAYEPGYDWGFTHFQKFDGYLANELTGLWLRGPYLHNGSVPTLAALLQPPAFRPDVFWRGSDLIDAEDGGFVSEPGVDPQRPLWRYDTALPGNANKGHLWGTELPPADKAALLAYLKTL